MSVCLYFCLSLCVFEHLSCCTAVCLFVCLPAFLPSPLPSCLPFFLPACLPAFLPAFPSASLLAFPPATHLPACLPACLPAWIAAEQYSTSNVKLMFFQDQKLLFSCFCSKKDRIYSFFETKFWIVTKCFLSVLENLGSNAFVFVRFQIF
jgi:hypothetical protein